MSPILPSWLQYLAKAALLLAAIVLAVLHDLSAPIAMVLSSALVALGVTNGAQLVAMSSSVANALVPPKAPPPPPAAIAGAAMAMIGLPVLVLILAHCGAYTPTAEDKALENQGLDSLCALHAAAEKLRDASAPDGVWTP